MLLLDDAHAPTITSIPSDPSQVTHYAFHGNAFNPDTGQAC
jgi:hypothetical protein